MKSAEWQLGFAYGLLIGMLLTFAVFTGVLIFNAS